MRPGRLPRLVVAFTLSAIGGAACDKSPSSPSPRPTSTPSQSDCSFTVGDTPAGDVPVGGGEFSITVAAGAGCSWSAASSAFFIAPIGATSGTGNGSVKFAVAPNTGTSRQGAIQVANRTLTVSQAAAVAGCEFNITPAQASVGSGRETVSVNVAKTSGDNCSWAATSNDPFIAIQSGASGTDTGTVALEVAANTGPARAGSATIAGRVLTISQAALPACAFSVSPTNLSIASTGGSAQIAVTVTSGTGCAWTAQSGSAFMTVPNGGVGSAVTTVQVAPNSGALRTGTLTVAGQTVTVEQLGVPTNMVAVLSYQSEPGDPLGLGLSNTFTLSATQFEVTLNAAQSDLRFRMPNSPHWQLWFRSTGAPLAACTYAPVGRAALASTFGLAGLDFFGDGRGCDRVLGKFLIQTAVFAGTEVQRFHARFLEYCDGFSIPIRGQLWIDASGAPPPPIADFGPTPTTPTTEITFNSDPGDPIGNGQNVVYTLAGLRFSAWAVGTRPAVDIAFQSATGPLTTNWRIILAAATGSQLQVGTYTGATRYPFSVNNGTNGLTVFGSGGCNTVTGSFVVHEVTYGPQGEVLRLRATFEQHCDGIVPALRGEVRIVADPWR